MFTAELCVLAAQASWMAISVPPQEASNCNEPRHCQSAQDCLWRKHAIHKVQEPDHKESTRWLMQDVVPGHPELLLLLSRCLMQDVVPGHPELLLLLSSCRAYHTVFTMLS
jgi:hypothetical protein